jgi:hypothetical protein
MASNGGDVAEDDRDDFRGSALAVIPAPREAARPRFLVPGSSALKCSSIDTRGNYAITGLGGRKSMTALKLWIEIFESPAQAIEPNGKSEFRVLKTQAPNARSAILGDGGIFEYYLKGG